MMGRQVAQGALFYGFRPDDHVPAGHLLRRIDGLLDFAFVREALAASYSTSGRPSIDPELMLRMLLVGYLFGIRSERRLCEEVHLNLAYRWFCRLDLADRVPDHSTFSKNRHGRFRACDLHRLLFEQVVARCAAAGLVAGRELAVDGSTIVADTSRERRLKGADAADELRARDTVSRPVAEYLAALDAALPPGPDEPAPVEPASISPTDPQAALTCKHGPARYAYAINPLLDLDTDCILDVEATPARFAAEVAATRTLVSSAGTKLGIEPASLSADKAYGGGPLLGWLIDRNITPYIPVIDRTRQRDAFFTRDAFRYDREADAYRCPADKLLGYCVTSHPPRRFREGLFQRSRTVVASAHQRLSTLAVLKAVRQQSPQGQSYQFRHEPSCRPLFRREIAIIGQRHARRLPPQRIHDPSEVLAARK